MSQPTQLPFVSFVVPLFNHLGYTQEMLITLQAYLPVELNYEIIFVDDASSDGTATWLIGLSDHRIKSMSSKVNCGFAKTCNEGARLASGEVLALVNNDLLFKPGWLEPMLDILESPHLNAGIVGNIQFRISDDSVDHAGVHITADGQLDHIHDIPKNNKSFDKNFATTGACMLIRKSDFDAVAGFDEVYVNGCEDVDLCFKIRSIGKEIYVAYQSWIHHHVSLSRQNNALQNTRNSRHLYARWRKELKQELSNVWLDLLKSGREAYAEKFNGIILQYFLDTPNIASRIIAESMLRREEYHFAKTLADNCSKSIESMKVSWVGLEFSQDHNTYLLNSRAEFKIEGLEYLCNFYVCGRRSDKNSSDIHFKFNVNGMQQLDRLVPGSDHNVNVGIVDPLFIANFGIHIHVDTTELIIITHIVINDQVINLH